MMKFALETMYLQNTHSTYLWKFGRTQKSCENTRLQLVFPQHFVVLPNFHLCFYNLIETRYVFSIS